MITLTNPDYRIISDHHFAEIRQSNISGQRSLYARQSFRPGDLICDFFAGEILQEPTYLTVQVNAGKHITLKPDYLQYINHSCSPNSFFDTTAMRLICIHAIQPGEEFTFFYPSTEWDMAQPFECYCGGPNCLGSIKGAAYIPAEILNRYRLTDFIQQQFHGRSREERA